MEEKKMDLESFLNLSNPEQFDFVEDTTGDIVAYRQIKDTFEKFFLYRVILTGNEKTKGIAPLLWDMHKENLRSFISKSENLALKDPDNHSNLLQEIYKTLWPNLKEHGYMKNDGNQIASDTMSSVQTTLNEAMKALKNEKNLKAIYRNGNVPCSAKSSIALAANEDETHFYEKLKEMYPNLLGFISNYHTIGNYCPVPHGFNSPRGFNNSKINDYWDLTLLYIYLWYESRNDDNLYVIVKSKESVELCKSWLKSFKTWSHFVEDNYMQDFVYYLNEDGDYGVPKELWKGHLYKGVTSLPKTPEQIEEFFNNTSEWILKRGNRMVEALKKIIHGEQ